MREQAAALLAHLRGSRTRFVSIGRTPDMPLALRSLVLTRNVEKSIKAARGALAACGDLPPLGPDDIAVVYLNGAGTRDSVWYVRAPCPKRAEALLAAALERGARDHAPAGDGEWHRALCRAARNPRRPVLLCDEPSYARVAERTRKAQAARRGAGEGWRDDEDEAGYDLPGTDPTLAGTQVAFEPDSGDNMMGLLITEEVRRRAAAPAPDAVATVHDAPAPAAPRHKKRARLELVEQPWFVDAEGNTRIGQPPAGCARCGLVRDGLLVGR